MTPAATATAIKVLLADDDDVFASSLRALIDRQPELSVVGVAPHGLAAIELVDELDPDAVVMDLHMPLLDGVSAVARLRRDHPHLCLIALTGDETPALHRAVSDAGADGVMLKTEMLEQLIERLATVHAHA
jgi:DNA-binding NarL/FixJ family response regulator